MGVTPPKPPKLANRVAKSVWLLPRTGDFCEVKSGSVEEVEPEAELVEESSDGQLTRIRLDAGSLPAAAATLLNMYFI